MRDSAGPVRRLQPFEQNQEHVFSYFSRTAGRLPESATKRFGQIEQPAKMIQSVGLSRLRNSPVGHPEAKRYVASDRHRPDEWIVVGCADVEQHALAA